MTSVQIHLCLCTHAPICARKWWHACVAVRVVQFVGMSYAVDRPPQSEAWGRYLFFHIVPGQHEAFARTFRRHFGATFVLLTAEEVERLQLLGPSQACAPAAGISHDLAAFLYVCKWMVHKRTNT